MTVEIVHKVVECIGWFSLVVAFLTVIFAPFMAVRVEE